MSQKPKISVANDDDYESPARDLEAGASYNFFMDETGTPVHYTIKMALESHRNDSVSPNKKKSKNKKASVRDAISVSSGYNQLSFPRSELSDFPWNMTDNINLQGLNLMHNRIRKICPPPEVCEFLSLQTLDLRGNRIASMFSLSSFPCLLTLNLQNNLIEDIMIPTSARTCTLRSLDVSSNRVQSLPNLLVPLPNLKSLYLSGNYIRHVPLLLIKRSIGNEGLDELDIKRNYLIFPPQYVGDQGLASMKVFCLGIEASEAISKAFNSACIVFRGSQSSGKSALIQQLLESGIWEEDGLCVADSISPIVMRSVAWGVLGAEKSYDGFVARVDSISALQKAKPLIGVNLPELSGEPDRPHLSAHSSVSPLNTRNRKKKKVQSVDSLFDTMDDDDEDLHQNMYAALSEDKEDDDNFSEQRSVLDKPFWLCDWGSFSDIMFPAISMNRVQSEEVKSTSSSLLSRKLDKKTVISRSVSQPTHDQADTGNSNCIVLTSLSSFLNSISLTIVDCSQSLSVHLEDDHTEKSIWRVQDKISSVCGALNMIVFDVRKFSPNKTADEWEANFQSEILHWVDIIDRNARNGDILLIGTFAGPSEQNLDRIWHRLYLEYKEKRRKWGSRLRGNVDGDDNDRVRTVFSWAANRRSRVIGLVCANTEIEYGCMAVAAAIIKLLDIRRVRLMREYAQITSPTSISDSFSVIGTVIPHWMDDLLNRIRKHACYYKEYHEATKRKSRASLATQVQTSTRRHAVKMSDIDSQDIDSQSLVHALQFWAQLGKLIWLPKETDSCDGFIILDPSWLMKLLVDAMIMISSGRPCISEEWIATESSSFSSRDLEAADCQKLFKLVCQKFGIFHSSSASKTAYMSHLLLAGHASSGNSSIVIVPSIGELCVATVFRVIPGYMNAFDVIHFLLPMLNNDVECRNIDIRRDSLSYVACYQPKVKVLIRAIDSRDEVIVVSYGSFVHTQCALVESNKVCDAIRLFSTRATREMDACFDFIYDDYRICPICLLHQRRWDVGNCGILSPSMLAQLREENDEIICPRNGCRIHCRYLVPMKRLSPAVQDDVSELHNVIDRQQATIDYLLGELARSSNQPYLSRKNSSKSVCAIGVCQSIVDSSPRDVLKNDESLVQVGFLSGIFVRMIEKESNECVDLVLTAYHGLYNISSPVILVGDGVTWSYEAIVVMHPKLIQNIDTPNDYVFLKILGSVSVVKYESSLLISRLGYAILERIRFEDIMLSSHQLNVIRRKLGNEGRFVRSDSIPTPFGSDFEIFPEQQVQIVGYPRNGPMCIDFGRIVSYSEQVICFQYAASDDGSSGSPVFGFQQGLHENQRILIGILSKSSNCRDKQLFAVPIERIVRGLLKWASDE